MCVLAAMLALVFVFEGSNVAANHEPKPHGLPLGVVGSRPAVAEITGRLSRRAPGTFTVFGYRLPAAARTAILHRSVYGARSNPAHGQCCWSLRPPAALSRHC
jgi:hypothetical protein